MNYTIKNGVTIIHTGDPVGGVKNNTTGHHGVTFKRNKNIYQAEIYIGRKNRYHLGFFENLEDAIAIRAEAEEHRANGTFHEWHSALYGRTKRTRAKK